MARAKKLPSGSWRCQVFSHYEEILQSDGSIKRKSVRKSFTCDDPSAKGKRKCEAEATAWALNKAGKIKSDYTFAQAYEKYLEIKENVLSQSTIRGYRQMCKYYALIKDVKLQNLSQQLVSDWVNSFAKNHSPKTVRNAHGLLTAILREFAPEITLHTVLPQREALTYTLPTDNEIQRIITYLKERDKDMLIAVYLAAFGTLRRSEVCGLTGGDIKGNTIHIHKAMVLDKNRNFVLKTTKTVSSNRYVELPAFVIDMMPKSGPVVSLTPDDITKRFRKTLKDLEIKPFRFHDLRHYSASVMHAIGVPDQYIMMRGGWKSDVTLKTIYRGAMDDYMQKYNDVTNSFFTAASHEASHKTEKTP